MLECSSYQIPKVVAFEWPKAVKHVITGNSGHVAAACFRDGSILWIADTGCGYHLVPEADISRGTSDIVPNKGATRLHTANGEVDAKECVRFSLGEINVRKKVGHHFAPNTPCSKHWCTLYG